MLELSCKAKGNAQPKGKPRVFFICHRADMERSLGRRYSALFQAQDRAAYITQKTDLESRLKELSTAMSLLVRKQQLELNDHNC